MKIGPGFAGPDLVVGGFADRQRYLDGKYEPESM